MTPQAASAMRTRRYRSDFAPQPDTERYRMVQQIAACPDVETVVVGARALQDSCGTADRSALPLNGRLPVGAQGRRIVFAEGADYSDVAFFRRGTAVAVVALSGDIPRGLSSSDVAQLLFAPLCRYEEPYRC